MKKLKTFDEFLNEGKAVKKQDWNRADDEQREKWLLSAIEDPNDIEDLVDAEWEDLPDVAISNMMKESLNEAAAYKNKNNIGDYVKFDDEKARIDNVYTAGNGKTMYTIGSSKLGTIDIEAEYIDENN